MKKNILILLFKSAIAISTFAQAFNGFVNDVTWTPEMSPGYALGRFACNAPIQGYGVFGMTTTAPSPLVANDPASVQVCINNLNFNSASQTIGSSASSIVSGTAASLFTWQYAGNGCIIGTQNQTIPGDPLGYGGTILVDVLTPAVNTSQIQITYTWFPATYMETFTPGFTSYPAGTTSANFVADTNGDDQISTNGSVQCVLPINLKSFNAELVGEEGFLTWDSGAEENFSHFDIEKSLNATNFDKIGAVKAKGAESKYNTIDRSLEQGINYYRLKMVDVDGTYSYSDIKALELRSGKSNEVAVFPNPFTGGFTTTGLGKSSNIKIFDMTGKMLYDQNTNDNVFRVEMPKLSAGFYNAVITSDDQVSNRKLIKVD